MPHLWYGSGMARTRISTTVDAALLAGARRARSGLADSALIDEALAALLARQRAAEIDAAYAAYDMHPLDQHDEWGDLASFREAARGVRDCPSGAWRGLVVSAFPEVGPRPVVVLSRDAAIPRLGRALIGPCTTTIRGIPSEVRLEPTEDPIPRISVVNLDSIESVSIGTLVERVGRLSDERMRQICDALVGCRRLPALNARGKGLPKMDLTGQLSNLPEALAELLAAVDPDSRLSRSTMSRKT